MDHSYTKHEMCVCVIVVANLRTDCQSLAFHVKHKIVACILLASMQTAANVEIFSLFPAYYSWINSNRCKTQHHLCSLISPRQGKNNQEKDFPKRQVQNLTRVFHNSIKHTLQDFVSLLLFHNLRCLANGSYLKKAIGTICDWGKSTLISPKAAVVSNHATLKVSIAGQKSCRRNWIIWTWEPNECFTRAQVTERPATSQWRVPCEAAECKSQLNVKSHPHILLKPVRTWE